MTTDLNNNNLIFFVNGKKIVDNYIDPEITLLQYLRERLKLPGTKLGCGEGGCGACTVMVSRFDHETNSIDHISVNACLCPVVCLHGLAVVTVEGIGSTTTRLHPVQERIAQSHGSQCGFCTPGFVMSMYALLRTDPHPSLEHIEENLVGNLCRCTGYRPIIEGFRSFSTPGVGCGIKNCCMLKGRNEIRQNENAIDNQEKKIGITNENETYVPLDSTQEVIFPPELKANYHLYLTDLAFVGPRVSYYRPISTDRLLELKNQFPQSKLVCGNTEIGIEVKFKKLIYPVLINPTFVKEMKTIKKEDDFFQIGACVTLSKIEDQFTAFIENCPEWQVRTLKATIEMLKLFAGKQIRNVATIGGNLMTGSPISDLIPILMASKAELILKNKDTSRKVIIGDSFFKGYRKNIVLPDELLMSIRIPYNDKNEFIYAFKQAKRKDDDIAIVNAAMSVKFNPDKPKVETAILSFGGMGPTAVLAKNTSEKMQGKFWNEELIRTGISSLLEELKLAPSVVGGMAEYRQTLAASFFYKYFIMVKRDLYKMYPEIVTNFTPEEKSAIKQDSYCEPQSWQLYAKIVGETDIDPVGMPIVHKAAFKQSSGEAIYVDDIRKYSDELYAGFVTSTRAKAKIINIDASAALKIEGIRGFYSAKDIPAERNQMGTQMGDKVFATNEVICVGQVIGLIVADDKQLAQMGADSVVITYEDNGKPIITIEDAIENDSVFGPFKLEIGDLETGFKNSSNILEGEVRMGGQEHFYMETYANVIVPNSEGELEMFCSTQDPTLMQQEVASTLGIPRSKVNCRTKRVGGGFGGKESRTNITVVPMAIAAYHLRKPIRNMLDRHEDMQMTGGRHPTLSRWKVGFNDEGQIIALQVTAYVNCGCTMDLSASVIKRLIFSLGSSYSIPNAKIMGIGCYTNLPSNTAFRGFGAPQAQFVHEDIMANIANFLKIDHHKVRYCNLYKRGDLAICGVRDERCNLKRCCDEVFVQSDFNNRLKRCKQFNRENTFRKRGINFAPTKFQVSFSLLSLNKGGALVNIYDDGSVLVSHGGVEMGQGLHTKIIQVASRALDVPIEMVSILETSTNIVPNTPPTAASTGSDLNGMAVMHACTELKKRLEPYKKIHGNCWKKVVHAANKDRICLSAEGFYKTPLITNYNYDTKEGNPYLYQCSGAAVTEVEIDCLTGHHVVLQTDIVMDIGNSLNPAIDIGQIEGAFVQGMGLHTIEELIYSPEGVLLTKGPGAYKIPSIQDVPRKFNVSLLKDAPNPRAVYSSKAVGEPPLLLATTVFFAIRQAIEARSVNKVIRLNSPATAERIRLACQDWITEQIPSPEPGSYKPWGIGI